MSIDIQASFSQFIRIPATSANLGPGFDCIGMAVALYNDIYFAPTEQVDELIITAEQDDGAVELSPSNLIYQAYARTFTYVGKPTAGLRIHCVNRVPLSRGLGSSSAAIIGGILVANHLLGEPLSTDEILQIAMEFEGHPDNLAPALLGGIVISGLTADGKVLYKKIAPPDNLYCYVLIPDYQLSTSKARSALPSRYRPEDAFFNISRMGFLVDAFHTGDFTYLHEATLDRLHQPYRQPLMPGMREITTDALALGAKSVTISGAGSSLLILCDHEVDFGELLLIWQQDGIQGRLLKTQAVTTGAALIQVK